MGDTPDMEAKRRLVEEKLPAVKALEEHTGTFSRFSFVNLLNFFRRNPRPSEVAKDFIKVDPLPEDKNVFRGTVTLDGPLIGRLWAGNSASTMRGLGMKIAAEVPDCAVISKSGAFEWFKIEFTIKPKEKTE